MFSDLIPGDKSCAVDINLLEQDSGEKRWQLTYFFCNSFKLCCRGTNQYCHVNA